MRNVGSPLEPPAPGRRRQTGLLASTATVTRRTLLRYVRTPQLILLATVQMSLFFLIYRYMFGGAIHIAGLSYVDYLVPGFIATGVLFSGIGTAAAMAEDLEGGFIDRLRSLPIPRASVLAARASADTAIFAWSTLFTAGIAFAFVSSAYVPVSSMPRWLQAFANHQPLTQMVDAVRSLTLGPHAHALLGHSPGYFVARALIWTVAILAVSLPIAVAKYRRG